MKIGEKSINSSIEKDFMTWWCNLLSVLVWEKKARNVDESITVNSMRWNDENGLTKWKKNMVVSWKNMKWRFLEKELQERRKNFKREEGTSREKKELQVMCSIVDRCVCQKCHECCRDDLGNKILQNWTNWMLVPCAKPMSCMAGDTCQCAVSWKIDSEK